MQTLSRRRRLVLAHLADNPRLSARTTVSVAGFEQFPWSGVAILLEEAARKRIGRIRCLKIMHLVRPPQPPAPEFLKHLRARAWSEQELRRISVRHTHCGLLVQNV